VASGSISSVSEALARMTGSQIDRAARCPASILLPHATYESSDAANRGNGIHRFLATAQTVGRDAALAEVGSSEERSLCELIDISIIPKEGYSEVAFGYNPETGAVTRYGTLADHRDYPADGLIHLTLDLYWVDHERDTCIAVDFKTGSHPYPAGETYQLLLGALVVARHHGVSTARVGIWRPSEDGWQTDHADLDAWALSEAEGKIKAAVDGVKAAYAMTVPPMNVGGWCRYCKAISFCTAQSAMTTEMARSLEILEPGALTLGPAEAGRLYAKLTEWEDKVKAAKEALRTLATLGAIPLPSGQTLKQVQWPTYTVAPEATAALVERFGLARVLETVTFSRDRISKTFGKEALAALEKAGLVKKEMNPVVRVVGRPGKAAATTPGWDGG